MRRHNISSQALNSYDELQAINSRDSWFCICAKRGRASVQQELKPLREVGIHWSRWIPQGSVNNCSWQTLLKNLITDLKIWENVATHLFVKISVSRVFAGDAFRLQGGTKLHHRHSRHCQDKYRQKSPRGVRWDVPTKINSNRFCTLLPK